MNPVHPTRALSPEESRRETADSWPAPAVEMLLAAWGATVGHAAFMTSTVADVVGSPPWTFRHWVSDHADAFKCAEGLLTTRFGKRGPPAVSTSSR